MKKLRVALIVLFAMLMSLALFACQNDNPDQPINPDDEAPAGQVDTVKAGAIQLDDQDQAKDLTDALNALDVTVTYDNDAQGKPVAAKTLKATTENFEIDSSALKFDEKGIAVGAYTVVITPKADNFYKATGNVVVNVEHNFQQEGDSLICKKDGATQTNVTFENPVEIGMPQWGNATTSKNLNEYVKAFGTVGSGASVNTFTVGRLDKGMTIKVTGTAIHDTESGTGDANACFPILGFADRDLTADGAGWLQRNDYLAIFNGVNDGTLSGFKTLGATQANATDGTEATDLLKPVVSGTSSQTDAYETEAEVEFTWNYSSDCVATVEWYTPGNGRRWTAKCLMPEKQSYESLLHGEACKMTIKSIAITQSLKLESIDTPAVKTGTKMLENTYFDKTALNFKAHYAGGFESIPDAAVMTVYGSTTEGLTKANMNGEEVVWNDLSTTKLSKKFKSFKVAVSMGSTTCEDILPASSFEIIANAVDHASPNEVTLTGATETQATFITGIDVVDFTVANNLPTLVVRGNALSLTDTQKQVLGATAATHSVAFSIYQFGETKFGNGTITIEGSDGKAKEAAVVGKAIVAENGESVDVVLAITKNTKSVTIKGVQATDIVVNFTEQAVDGQGTAYESVLVLGRPITSVMTASYEQKLNRKQENDVTIVYNLGDRANGLTAQSLSSEFKFTVNDNSATYFDADGEGANNGDRNPANVANMPGIQNMKVKSLTFNATAKTITIVYEVPAFNPEAPISYKFALEDMKKSNEILAVDYLYYVPAFDTTPAEGETGYAIAENLYASVQGTKLYLSLAVNSSNIVNTELNSAFALTLNAGAKTPEDFRSYDYLQKHDLSFVYGADGAVSFSGKIAVDELATVSGKIFGSINNADDTDRGAVTVITIDVTKLGYDADTNSTFYFKVASSNDVFAADLKNGTVTKLADAVVGEEEKYVGEKTCTVPVPRYYDVTKGTEVVYWDILGETELIPHEWDDDVCSVCGAIRFNVTEGATKYTFVSTPALTKVTNAATINDGWWTAPSEAVAVSGNFILHYTWNNIDANYNGNGAIEMFNAKNQFFGYRTFVADFNPAGQEATKSNSALHGADSVQTHVFKIDGQVVEALTGPTDWSGVMDILVYRYGTTLIIDATQELGGKVYQTTTTITKFTTDDLSVRIAGHPYYCSDIKVSLGTVEAVTTSNNIKTTVQSGSLGMTYGAKDNSTPYTGTEPLWTMEFKPGMTVEVSGLMTNAGASVWQSALAYVDSYLNFRPDNFINGTATNNDNDNNVNGNEDLLSGKHWLGFWSLNEDGEWAADATLNADWFPPYEKYIENKQTYTQSITWDWTNEEQIEVTYIISGIWEGKAVQWRQGYYVKAKADKSLAETYQIGIGVDGAHYEVSYFSVSEPVSAN